MKNAYEKLENAKSFITLHAYHLQTYELASYMDELKNAENKLNEKKENLPKKKFAFSSKPIKSEKPQEAAQPIVSETPLVQLSKNDIEIKNLEKKTEYQEKSIKNDCYCFIGNNIECKINVPNENAVKQLYCNKNENCIIQIGKVLGSALIYNCKNCKFILSAHQIRIHNTENCEFTLFAGSGPIIEDSTKLIFKEIEKSLIPDIYLDKKNVCNEVMDFNWHKKEKSPNWEFSGEIKDK